MPEKDITPKRKPPRHPVTGPVQTDTMPERPKPEILTEKEESQVLKRIPRTKGRRAQR